MLSGCSVGLVFYIFVTGVDSFFTSLVAYVFESEVEMEICLKHIGWVDTMRAAFAEAQGGVEPSLLLAPGDTLPAPRTASVCRKNGEKRGKLGGRRRKKRGKNKRWRSKGRRLEAASMGQKSKRQQ